jgi:hypothetical protein
MVGWRLWSVVLQRWDRWFPCVKPNFINQAA